MVEILTTKEFDHWLRSLKDRRARLRILSRLDRLAGGTSATRSLWGGGVVELRLASGPGYRVYLTRRGNRVVLLLCGGDKSSQSDDIRRACQLAAQWTQEEGTDD